MDALNGRVEIDMRPPFRSVKEAVSLFGERVFTADFHTNKIAGKCKGSNAESRADALEDTKQSLEKAQEETKWMTNQMSCLKEELEKAKRELQELKDLQESKRHLTKMMADLQDMEDLKYVAFAYPSPPNTALERHPRLSTKNQRKPFTIPLIGAIFPRRRTKPNLRT